MYGYNNNNDSRERERERERVMIFYDFRQRSPKVAFFLAKRGAHTSGAS